MTGSFGLPFADTDVGARQRWRCQYDRWRALHEYCCICPSVAILDLPNILNDDFTRVKWRCCLCAIVLLGSEEPERFAALAALADPFAPLYQDVAPSPTGDYN